MSSGKLKCLVVEDEDGWFKEIENDLKVQLDDLRPEITRAISVENYAELQKKAKYDVVILDIRLASQVGGTNKIGGDDDGGLEIVRHASVWNTDAVIILLSAYIKDDVDNAVIAMRNGAWDCIDKSEKLATRKRLIKSIRQGLARTAPYDKWFRANVATLCKDYAGQYIAVADGKRIANAPGFEEVREAVRKTSPLSDVKFYLVPTTKW